MERIKTSIVSHELLKPSTNLNNPPKFNLTVFDRLMLHASYQLRVLFYKPPLAPYEDVVQLLKRSLADALVIFYPVAGRLLNLGDGTLQLDCGLGQSVKFTQAVTDATIAQLGPEIQPSEFCDSLCGVGSPHPKYPWSPEDPLLFVQVTKFRCGGISLGFAFSHQIADGVSVWHFMKSWAELARTGAVKVAPDITYDYKVLQLTKEQVKSELNLSKGVRLTPLDQFKPPDVVGAREPRTRRFTMDRRMIDKLKAEAEASTNGTRFTTFVVLSAYFWRKITLARELPDSTPSNFLVTVNSRGRSPSLSPSYFGNAASGCIVEVQAGELKRSGIGGVASLLQKEISAWDAEQLDIDMSCMDCVLRCPQEFGLLRVMENSVRVSGSPRHPVYETDFGFGKPVDVTFGSSLGDGILYMFPTPGGDGVSVSVVLKSDDMERLTMQEACSC